MLTIPWLIPSQNTIIFVSRVIKIGSHCLLAEILFTSYKTTSCLLLMCWFWSYMQYVHQYLQHNCELCTGNYVVVFRLQNCVFLWFACPSGCMMMYFFMIRRYMQVAETGLQQGSEPHIASHSFKRMTQLQFCRVTLCNANLSLLAQPMRL